MLGRSFRQGRFLVALVATNFAVVPTLVAVLLAFAPADPLVRLDVPLCPCIDYVVIRALPCRTCPIVHPSRLAPMMHHQMPGSDT